MKASKSLDEMYNLNTLTLEDRLFILKSDNWIVDDPLILAINGLPDFDQSFKCDYKEFVIYVYKHSEYWYVLTREKERLLDNGRWCSYSPVMALKMATNYINIVLTIKELEELRKKWQT